MVAFSYRMPAGIPGECNRVSQANIETQVVSTASGEAPTVYGVPVVISSTSGNVGNMRAVASGDTAVYGMYVRPFPTGASQDVLGTSTPPTSGIIDVLKRGYMTVYLQGLAAAAKGGLVYAYQGTTNTADILVGGIEASSATNAILLPAYFMGPADSNNMVEIGFNI